MASEPVKIAGPLKFGEDYELDIESYKLYRAGRVLKLERIPMEILLLLVKHRGRLVSREEIVEQIWGKGVFLDTDNSLNGAIRKIRQVLEDDPEEPRFVQTVTGRGYRFIAPAVEGVPRVPAPPPPTTRGNDLTDKETDRQPPVEDKAARQNWRLALGVAVVLIAALAGYLRWSKSRPRAAAPTDRPMLAVLPFENLTGDPAQDYFSDGLTEEMITQLGRVNPAQLGVIARTSVMLYKRNLKPLDEIGQRLGVQYVLEGSVRRKGDRVRITAQLIQLKDQTHVWAQEYDRDLKDIFVIQSDIAGEIASETQMVLRRPKAGAPTMPRTLSPERYEAYDLYLKGLYFWNKRTTEGFQEAIQYFQQATEKAPGYAPAYAGLADAYALIGGYSGALSSEFAPKARSAALRAVELDDSSPEAHTALALIVQNSDYDWQTSEKEFKRAIELNPNYATAHHWYAEHFMWQGRFDEALAESERARQLDPLSLIIAADNGAILYYSRQYDRAIKKFTDVSEMDPTFWRISLLEDAYLENGMSEKVLSDVGKFPEADTPWYWSRTGFFYGRTGRNQQARRALAKLMDLNRRTPVDPMVIVHACLGTGDKDATLYWLEKSYAQRSSILISLKVDPAYDPLRSDPRFQQLVAKVFKSKGSN